MSFTLGLIIGGVVGGFICSLVVFGFILMGRDEPKTINQVSTKLTLLVMASFVSFGIWQKSVLAAIFLGITYFMILKITEAVFQAYEGKIT